VSFSVFRNGAFVGQSEDITVGTDGLAEVNHPGGGCWLADTQTPNIRPGDVVRITNLATHTAEQTTVANVTADQPTSPAKGTVVVTGMALNPDGTPMDLANVEERLVNAAKFANGKRTLRATVAPAAGQGTLKPGATPGSWVATYTGLSSTDVTKALAAESRVLWLGPDPAAGTQLTIYERPDPINGIVNGPALPCTAPAETG
jgi:hypothetical protein